ncbi:hypothetical protein BJY04DRAFT_220327 [Aspergillus karnatakaensis]|uniref:LysM peptidoglycan-binding domain-containing protein n=1 Tax=Aspergillus karnatakaensis TaxID=1810916 RepID=UPI003CCDC38C
MFFSKPTLLTLSVLPTVLLAGNVRRSGDDPNCRAASAARTDDSCERFARSYKITVQELLELNPELDCDHWDDQGYYCFEAYPNTTISGTSNSTTSASSTPTASSATTANETETGTETTTAETETPTGAAALRGVPGLIGVSMTVVVGYLAGSVLL